MKRHIPHKFIPYVYILLGILMAMFLLLTYFLVREYYALSTFRSIHGKHTAESGRKMRHVLGARDIALISPWMTFEYVSRVFDIPVSYIQKQMSIDDTAFPRITLYRYARHKGYEGDAFVGQVREVVGEYLLQEKKVIE